MNKLSYSTFKMIIQSDIAPYLAWVFASLLPFHKTEAGQFAVRSSQVAVVAYCCGLHANIYRHEYK